MRVLLLILVLAQTTSRIPIRVIPTSSEPSAFHLSCESSELSGTTNGSTVTPTHNLGPTGTLVVNGSGGVNFDPMVSGDGVQFTDGGQQVANSAHYKFVGTGLGNVWDAEKGEITFSLKSSYSWDARQALTPNRLRYVYDVYDANGPAWNFVVTVFEGSPNRLKLVWGQNAYGTEYDIPAGDEDTTFGNGVTMGIRITWDGTNHATDQGIAHLYVNGALAQNLVYTFTPADWDEESVAIIGAQASPEGYFSLDDRLDELYVYAQAEQHPGIGIIPTARLTLWDLDHVGVPGGIPTTRTQCVTTECVALTGAAAGYKNGTDDAQALIQAAITSASANTFVLMPAGTWKILSGLVFSQADDNVTLRGAGVDDTVIDCRANTCISLGTAHSFNYPQDPVTNFAASGANSVLTMADTSNIGGTGTLVKVLIENDVSIPTMSTSGYQYTRLQITKVVSKTSTTVTVFPAIYGIEQLAGLHGNISSEPWDNKGYGLEDFTVDANLDSVGNRFACILISDASGSWVKNVKSIRAQNYTLYVVDSLNIEVRHSEFGQLVGGGTNGAGILFNSNSGGLIEDNIITEAFPGFEINAGTGGSVFAYNFVHNANGAFGFDINHGSHNRFNLYEGNVMTNVISDGYFGGESESTLYRNLIHGNGIEDADTNTFCISLKRFSRRASVIGDVWGGPFSTASCNPTDANGSFGQPNIGNGSWTGTAQPSVGDWWADFNDVDGTTIAGQLTTRTDDYHGILTLSSGSLAELQTPVLHQNVSNLSGSTILAVVQVTAVSGNVVTIDSSFVGQTLPTLNTLVRVFAGASGFQEKDLDVEASTVLAENYDSFTDTVYDGSAVLTSSLFRTSKPSFFGALAWPPVNPLSPTFSYEIIPAGYRYVHGVDPTPQAHQAAGGVR